MRNLLIIIAAVALLAGCTPKVKEAITVPAQTESNIASIHIVNKDESLYKIAQKYGITAEEIIALNPSLKNNKLKKGMKLYIPIVTKKETGEVKQDTVKVVEAVLSTSVLMQHCVETMGQVTLRQKRVWKV